MSCSPEGSLRFVLAFLPRVARKSGSLRLARWVPTIADGLSFHHSVANMPRHRSSH
jgi:hypothetical protein